MDSDSVKAQRSTVFAPSSEVRVLLDDWFDSDQPSTVAPVSVWVARFRSLGGFVFDERVAEDRRPSGPMRLYRAATVDGARGMSWTPFRLVAAATAQRDTYE